MSCRLLLQGQVKSRSGHYGLSRSRTKLCRSPPACARAPAVVSAVQCCAARASSFMLPGRRTRFRFGVGSACAPAVLSAGGRAPPLVIPARTTPGWLSLHPNATGTCVTMTSVHVTATSARPATPLQGGHRARGSCRKRATVQQLAGCAHPAAGAVRPAMALTRSTSPLARGAVLTAGPGRWGSACAACACAPAAVPAMGWGLLPAGASWPATAPAGRWSIVFMQRCCTGIAGS